MQAKYAVVLAMAIIMLSSCKKDQQEKPESFILQQEPVTIKKNTKADSGNIPNKGGEDKPKPTN